MKNRRTGRRSNDGDVPIIYVCAARNLGCSINATCSNQASPQCGGHSTIDVSQIDEPEDSALPGFDATCFLHSALSFTLSTLSIWHMDREPIIWRPNALSPEEWDAKSRESQIEWWRQNRPQNIPSSGTTMSDVRQHYEKGKITVSECFIRICERATDVKTPHFLNECSDQLLTILREQLEKCHGNDPHEWPRSFFMGSFAPWTTPEEIDAS